MHVVQASSCMADWSAYHVGKALSSFSVRVETSTMPTSQHAYQYTTHTRSSEGGSEFHETFIQEKKVSNQSVNILGLVSEDCHMACDYGAARDCMLVSNTSWS